ncbi:PREDICTED: zinc finger protein 511-like [Lupinus angustifolius]|uniref:zinc finger protein 511-like n=1 Tax=Lupinus angustifolius TaxID=3871 RepID=UPI00092F624B|nr:PREDICTED: zinc finger protein 511-like [Lupinus angustifolius]
MMLNTTSLFQPWETWVALELTEEKQQLESWMQEDGREVFCPIVGCGARLISMEDFENHYNARHTAVCSVCSRVYPTSRLLSIHISEAHDSFFQAKVARGYDMYECLVEGCGLKFKSYNSRQQHLVDKHKFPTTFEFYKKARSSKKHRLKSQRKQPFHKEDASGLMEVENAAIDDLASAVSKLSTSDSTPSSISFGHRRKGMTFVPRSVRHGSGSNP